MGAFEHRDGAKQGEAAIQESSYDQRSGLFRVPCCDEDKALTLSSSAKRSSAFKNVSRESLMMEFNLSTPALLFPAISLLLLAYTNRFLAVASVIRQLHAQVKGGPAHFHEELKSLRHRVDLIRQMQGVGVLSLFFCVLCMFLLFAGWVFAGKIIFGIALLLLLISLALSVREIQLSGDALNLHLSDLEKQ